MGRKVLERLDSYELLGPIAPSDDIRDASQMLHLGLLREAYITANSSCPDKCVSLSNPLKPDLKISQWRDIGSKGMLSVRLVELCVNMMAEEGTFYHSDHSMPRCLFHGVYAEPHHAGCDGSYIDPDNKSKIKNLFIGMCHYDNGCNGSHSYQLTCHRMVANHLDLSSKPDSSLLWLPPQEVMPSQILLKHNWTNVL